MSSVYLVLLPALFITYVLMKYSHSEHKHKLIYSLLIVCIIIINAISIQYDHFDGTLIPWNSNTRIVIATSHYNEDLTWLLKSPWPVVVCSKLGSADIPQGLEKSLMCAHQNVGFEASSYLQFIISFYDTLPENVAFIHGHEHAWHQNVDILEAIKCAKIEQYGFVSLNIEFNRATSFEAWAVVHELWPIYFAKYVKKEVPENFSWDYCAQFMVSRFRIHRYPKHVYQEWLDMLHTESNRRQDGKLVAMAFEYMWHLLFGDILEWTEGNVAYARQHFSCKSIVKQLEEKAKL